MDARYQNRKLQDLWASQEAGNTNPEPTPDKRGVDSGPYGQLAKEEGKIQSTVNFRTLPRYKSNLLSPTIEKHEP